VTLLDFIASHEEFATNEPMLPYVHGTRYKFISGIAADKAITPVHCHVFDKELCYFFYGKHAFRLKPHKDANGNTIHTALPALAPVVFVFKPTESFSAAYTFDTGAADAGLFEAKLGCKGREAVKLGYIGNDQTAISRTKSLLFGTNLAYLNGDTTLTATSMDQSFIVANYQLAGIKALLTDSGLSETIDRRRRTIEIQTETSMRIEEGAVLAIAYPQGLELDANFAKVLALTNGAERLCYSQDFMCVPSEADAAAAQKIYDFVKNKYIPI
jgi:hypothetical protein